MQNDRFDFEQQPDVSRAPPELLYQVSRDPTYHRWKQKYGGLSI